MALFTARRTLLALSTLCLWGCTQQPGENARPGDACETQPACGSKLVCASNGQCKEPGLAGTTNLGGQCTASEDCRMTLVCGGGGACTNPGNGAKGDSCNGHDSCEKGLLCSSTRLCAEPGAPGSLAPGQTCDDPTACALGLVCLLETCTPLTNWPGATCDDPSEDSQQPRALFEIPRDLPLSEFYRLPFPNDIRRADGHVDVSAHPNPGTALPPPFDDVVATYLSAIKRDVTAYSLIPTVFFRFSQLFDPATRRLDGDAPTVRFVNITKDSPGYGQGPSQWGSQSNAARGKYICHNWFAVQPTPNSPLLPNATYAVLLLEGLQTPAGQPILADDDFAIVIGNNEPDDPAEKAAWNAYAPLREYLEDQAMDPSKVLGAAVFTTADPRSRMAKLRDAVHEQPWPQVDNLTLCDGKTPSPCDDGGEATHACPDLADGAYHELQGTYQTPVFQAGTPPYSTPTDGGAIAYDSQGHPQRDRDETVCVAMSLPKTAEMPLAGWPVVIFAHGTGGSYRSFITNGTAAALAHIKDATGTALGHAAVISIDGSMHGARRGTDAPPEGLFFNLGNPSSARDNIYQGAADKFQLVRLVESLDVAVDSPTGQPIRFDPDRVYFFGHSQGAIEGGPFLAFEPSVKGAVMSGAGGYLLASLLNKQRPDDIRSLVQFALADGQLDTFHPLLNLLQLYFDEVDTLHYGRAWVTDPLEGVGAKHLLMGHGTTDGFTPPPTIVPLTQVAGLSQVQRCGDGVCGGEEDCTVCPTDCSEDACEPGRTRLNHVPAPLTANVSHGNSHYTAAVVEYSSHDGTYDDHFVLFRHPEAAAQVSRFFGTALRDGVPTITEGATQKP